MTELVDVLVSGTSFSNGVGVRVSPITPKDSKNVHFYTFGVEIKFTRKWGFLLGVCLTVKN